MPDSVAATELAVRWLPYVSPAAAVRAVTEWLRNAERFDRSYSVFEKYLRVGHGEDESWNKRYLELHGDLLACRCGSGKSYATCHGLKERCSAAPLSLETRTEVL